MATPRAQRTAVSDVNATDLPSPYCQCARIGSFSLPRSETTLNPSRSAATMYPAICGTPPEVRPRIGSLTALTIVGANGSPSQINERFTICASLMKIAGSLANSPSSMIEWKLPPGAAPLAISRIWSKSHPPVPRLCGYTSTVEMLIPNCRQSLSSVLSANCGSPSEMMIMCLAPALAAFRSLIAILIRLSNVGMSPKVSELIARVTAALFPTSLSGCTHQSPLPNEYSSTPIRSSRDRLFTAASATCCPQ